VRVIQYLLNARGFRVSVNGVYGKSTTAAVRAFQRKIRIAADGHVGSATWPRLVVTVKRGSRGYAVRALQHQIRYEDGYKPVVVNGVFGARMQAAVKVFQAKHGLRVNGVVGVATWSAMEAAQGLTGFSSVNTSVRITAPTGTRVTIKPTTNGNCAKQIQSPAPLTTDASPWPTDRPAYGLGLFVVNSDGLCNYMLTSQQFLVTADYPDGTNKFRLVNYQQRLHIGYSYESTCAYGNLPCEGGVDTTYLFTPSPPLTIGGP
jgi:peptidoglycan hydrolase-like protein with peptidoglycan-binding domain